MNSEDKDGMDLVHPAGNGGTSPDVLRQALEALEDVTQALCWQAFGECRNITDRFVVPPDEAEAVARKAIASLRSALSAAPGECLQRQESVHWERRRGYGYGDGINALNWQAWEPCTESDAKRVTGLRSWQVRRLDCLASLSLQLPPGEHLESETQQAVLSKENKQ